MNIKLLLFATWLFWLAARRTADGFWLFCMIYSGILTACAFFYNLENKPASPVRKEKKKS